MLGFDTNRQCPDAVLLIGGGVGERRYSQEDLGTAPADIWLTRLDGSKLGTKNAMVFGP